MTSKIELQATVKTLQALYNQEAELKEAIKKEDKNRRVFCLPEIK